MIKNVDKYKKIYVMYDHIFIILQLGIILNLSINIWNRIIRLSVFYDILCGEIKLQNFKF